ncbi:PF01973 family protein [Leptospira broomii serovar Hurstbridge str. 5399]|uniref:PF01973 family protein n=1 Tax=Leptospira broomii serovar Hurstbridge str. 5399 TaxID=1049789 RepID=T0F7M6_9LEPT|nr:6-hydroxymethylpterin diphosphokinase MptE-like protein [Leptospira broomii]EQA47085.1 PF01973 family protein [Leptospira broomii serovar Hurstbridge str. 5399]
MNTRILCLEPFAEFEPLVGDFVRREIGSIPIWYDWKKFQTLPTSSWIPEGIRSLKVFLHPTYARKFPEVSQEILSFLQNIGFADQNQIAKDTYEKLWIHNFFRHAKRFQENPSAFRIIGKKLPVRKNQIGCFIGASPNLELQRDWIEKNRTKVYLLASDTSLGFLLQNNILPDSILSIDSGRGTGFHFPENTPDQIPIITWLGGSARIFDLPNPKILYVSTHPLDQLARMSFFPEAPILENPTLNIAGMAVSVLDALGFESCIVKGFDFSRTAGKTHCRGSGYERYDRFFLTRRRSLFLGRYSPNASWIRRTSVLNLWKQWSPLTLLEELPKDASHSTYWKNALLEISSEFPRTGSFWRNASVSVAEFPSRIRSILMRESRILE